MRHVALALLLAASSVARAAEPLDGTWLLDAAASDRLDPMLEALGVSTFERLLARRVSVTQIVDDQGDRLRVVLRSAMRVEDRTSLLDGVPREEIGDNGEPAVVTWHRDEDGSIVTDIRAHARDGVDVHLRTRRSLQPDGTMLFQISGERAGMPPFSLRRVFRRQG